MHVNVIRCTSPSTQLFYYILFFMYFSLQNTSKEKFNQNLKVPKKSAIVQTIRILNRFLTSFMFLFRFCSIDETTSLDLRLEDDPSLLLLLLSKTHDLIDFTPTSTNFREEDEVEVEKEEPSSSLNDGLLDPNLVSALVGDMTTNNDLVLLDEPNTNELCDFFSIVDDDNNDWTNVHGPKKISRRQVCSSSSSSSSSRPPSSLLPSLGSYDDDIDVL